MRFKLNSLINGSTAYAGRMARVARVTLSYLGPGFFVTVGFIDPGNWATNVAAGSEFNYDLLWVVALGTLILILWQHMSAHLGIVTGKCLAEAAREHTRPWAATIYGSTAMAACIATALAEILGAAIGFQVLLGLPLRIAIVLSTALVCGMIYYHRYEALEKVIVAFVSVIGLCYLAELYLVQPNWKEAVIHTVVPKLNGESIIIAMGVLGAVVMPHNMYLHSEVIQNRNWKGESEAATRRLLRLEFLDTLLAMLVGFAINAAMIMVAAAVFHRHGAKVNDLVQAAETLRPLAGPLACGLFGVALLFAGLSSSVTAGVAGGTTFSGYCGRPTALDSKWFRIGVVLTIIPACVLSLVMRDTFQALILSQVCLSIQLPLTMLPLFLLTCSGKVMGKYRNGWLETWAMAITGMVVLVLNLLLLYRVFGGRM